MQQDMAKCTESARRFPQRLGDWVTGRLGDRAIGQVRRTDLAPGTWHLSHTDTQYGPLIRSCRGNPCSAKLSVPVPTQNHSGGKATPKTESAPKFHPSLTSLRQISLPKVYTQLLQQNSQTVSTPKIGPPNLVVPCTRQQLPHYSQLLPSGLNFFTSLVPVFILITMHCFSMLCARVLVEASHRPPITTTMLFAPVSTRKHD